MKTDKTDDKTAKKEGTSQNLTDNSSDFVIIISPDLTDNSPEIVERRDIYTSEPLHDNDDELSGNRYPSAEELAGSSESPVIDMNLDVSPDRDDEFSAFMNEVTTMPLKGLPPPRRTGLINATPLTSAERQAQLMEGFKISSVDVKWGSGHEQVERILKNRYTASHFELFLLPPYATEELIRKHYKKLSVLIHPDKCKHPEASDAFFMVSQAYEELLKPEFRAKYVDVIEEAKHEVLLERKRQNKLRAKRGEELLRMDDDAIRADTIAKCDAIVKNREERLEYADRTKRENEIRCQRVNPVIN